MDIIYHYPPELFNLLIDTIPLLFRSKMDVLLFFRGAGVNYSTLQDLFQRVEYDRNNIHKYEITRTVLSRLNERGETTLRERREIIKRVTEFEDFSTCWPDDQLKARGLVAEIRRVVHVKDSFTRMQQAREEERRKRIAEQRAKAQAAKQKREELETVKNELFVLFGMPKSESQERGKMLEGVLNSLFQVGGILVREAFQRVGDEGEGVIEQIDGVVEIDGDLYLVEMKWWKHPLGKADVSPHLVNVFNRGHAGGILISACGFTDPAINVCKEALSKKTVILCELEEIVQLLETQENLKDFLKSKIRVAIIDRNPLFKPLG